MSGPDGRIYHVLTALLGAGAALACELYGGLSCLARWLPDLWNLHTAHARLPAAGGSRIAT